MIADSGPEGVPLSNVKRMLRTDFCVDLSETALGHATVTDLFKDNASLDNAPWGGFVGSVEWCKQN